MTPEKKMRAVISEIMTLPFDQRIEAINECRKMLHEVSPFRSEPVDFVRWVKQDNVHANDYNPNSVAPAELELLRISIESDGYTQPIVTMLEESGEREVIDGFHRNRVGKECQEIKERVFGYLPVVQIKEDRKNKEDRIAATIRHNRARGKHKITSMSEIVLDLKKRNWSSEKIAKNLGMDADEVLRLSQIGGIAESFSDSEFSQAWEAQISNEETID